MKMYFESDGEHCYTKEYFIDLMHLREVDQMEVWTAKRMIGVDFFFCRSHYEVGEKGLCGLQCKEYEPRNGKSGICKHNSPCYEQDKKVILSLFRGI